jgi:uncharacterized protein (DUF302 family)
VTAPAGVVTKVSARSVAETVTALETILRHRGLKVFAVIDQREAARAVGLDLRETTLVIFGNPAAGTGIMDAVPLVALELPLKVLVWGDEDGTKVSYTAPAALVARYGLAPEQAAVFEGLEGLTDALVAD